ncbi:MAG: hypothetical protein K8U03_16830 [Planctomycetia bacterium]|nr:hypothetical protein [Planctomycetia bacterium]
MRLAVLARIPRFVIVSLFALGCAAVALRSFAQDPKKPVAVVPKPAATPIAPPKPSATATPTASPTGTKPAPAPSSVVASYAAQRDFLAKHTKVLELTDGRGAHVAICPEWQGRVMTSSCEGPEGPGFGWLNEPFIRAGKLDAHFNNYGGEDRFWLGPEAGQFGLWFAPGKKQTLADWFTPATLNAGPFAVSQQTEASFYHMTRGVQLQNAKGTRFDLAVARDVRLLSAYHFGEFFGAPAAKLAADGKLKLVGFESRNVVTNKAKPLAAAEGLVSIWTLGMFPPGPQTALIVPYRSDADAAKEAALGPIVNTDYFGKIPPERLLVLPKAILFRGDGTFRAKLGVSTRRAVPYMGAIDFASGTLTLIHFTMPSDPAGAKYVNNQWQLPQAEPFVGDIANVYNDGPAEPGKPSLGGFYELESSSPAQELATGQSLTHHHRTFHLRGNPAVLAAVMKAVLGIDAEEAKRFLAEKAK